MGKEGLIHRIKEGINDMLYIWQKEMKQSFSDEGVIIFFILVPLLYPLLYSWLYNNEVVREAPVVVVDHSHSALSREFIRRYDASSMVKVISYEADMEAAKDLMHKQKARGIIYVPEDFSSRINRMEQAFVSIYADMSGILYYKNLLTTATNVSLEMGKEIKIQRMGSITERDEEIGATPLEYEEVPMFNPAGGYGSFLLPGVLVLIIQQTLLLGIGLAAGTAREKNKSMELVPISRHYNGIFRIVMGKGLCYFMIYAIVSAYILLVVPRMFHFIQLAHLSDLIGLMLPFLLACIFFGLTLSCLVRYRENVILLLVFTSVPLLFMSGVSWPASNIPGAWKAISYLFPSTFGINGFIRLNSLGGTLSDILPEYRALWLQVLVYFITACAVYRYQILLTLKRTKNRKKMNIGS